MRTVPQRIYLFEQQYGTTISTWHSTSIREGMKFARKSGRVTYTPYKFEGPVTVGRPKRKKKVEKF